MYIIWGRGCSIQGAKQMEKALGVFSEAIMAEVQRGREVWSEQKTEKNWRGGSCRAQGHDKV